MQLRSQGRFFNNKKFVRFSGSIPTVAEKFVRFSGSIPIIAEGAIETSIQSCGDTVSGTTAVTGWLSSKP